MIQIWKNDTEIQEEATDLVIYNPETSYIRHIKRTYLNDREKVPACRVENGTHSCPLLD